ncbi:FKBP-type peptidyl-prolyl cis-trans isomerase [Micrococcales bacterium 31B]|nr:FKBP-type peptidyl-prolyl cis-trans isomerase [Micrococcales bacterium 31B]
MLRKSWAAWLMVAALVLSGCQGQRDTGGDDSSISQGSEPTSDGGSDSGTDATSPDESESPDDPETSTSTSPDDPETSTSTSSRSNRVGGLTGLRVDLSGDEPVLQGNFPVTVTEATADVLERGDGELIKVGDLTNYSTISFDLKTGDPILQSYTFGGQPLPYEEGRMPKVIIDSIEEPRFGMTGYYTVELDGAWQFIVFRLDEPVDLKPGVPIDADKLPKVTLNGNAKPTLEKPSTSPPPDTQVAILQEGDGAEIQDGDLLTIRYASWTWADGKEFYSSYGTSNSVFDIRIGEGRMHLCLERGLKGQKVGSIVEVACPARQAFGEIKTSASPGDALVYVVEIVAAN